MNMDFLKEKLGIEVQFGKYAFMVYNEIKNGNYTNRKVLFNLCKKVIDED